MDFKARWLDPGISKWSQPDTMIPDLSNPQSLNRYSYVMNRPTVLTDPSGHDPYWCTTAACESEYAYDANGVIGGHAKKQGDDSRTGATHSYSTTVSAGYSIPGNSNGNQLDYSSDNASEDIECGDEGLCAIPGFLSLFERFPAANLNQTSNANFWINLSVNWDETSGTTISDVNAVSYSGTPIALLNRVYDNGISSPEVYTFPRNDFVPQGFGASASIPSPASSFSPSDSVIMRIGIAYPMNFQGKTTVVWPALVVSIPSAITVGQYIKIGQAPQLPYPTIP